MKAQPWAVVCDFDGTATVDDTADALSIEYIGYERWKKANDAFHAGEIAFEQLLAICGRAMIPFVLASGGLDIYIRPALEKLPVALTDGIEVRANHAEYVAGGLALTFPYQHAEGACGTCGSCKGAVVKELQAKGHRVISVGDGNADRCMAGVADVLFARGRLLDWCRGAGFACTPFETLHVVAARLG